MDIDIAANIGAVNRAVSTGARDGRPTKIVTATRSYPADIADVWDAVTNRHRVSRWFMPVSGDLRLGGRFKLEGNAEGEILECRPPEHLSVTWEYGGEVSWVTVRLSADGDRTTLRLEHVAPVDDSRWSEYGPGAVGVGWDLALLGLDLYVASGTTVDGEAWMSSSEGKAYMRASSDGWSEAAIAAGTPEAEAREAGARTTAAYTGEG